MAASLTFPAPVSAEFAPRTSAATSVSPRRRRCVRFAAVAALALSVSWSAVESPLHAEVQIERGYLPLEAGPSSFAIGLPGGINFCFDPLRGGVSYVWTGGFLDLSTMRPGPGKFIQPAKLLGPVAYQEAGAAPLRRGDPARLPVVEFAGYSLRDDSVEFRYTVDGTLVREEIRASADGTKLLRRFRIDGAADARWWHVANNQPATELKRDASGALLLEISLPKPIAP